ncbi:MAG: hemolysin family protein [Ahrensia sp.]
MNNDASHSTHAVASLGDADTHGDADAESYSTNLPAIIPPAPVPRERSNQPNFLQRLAYAFRPNANSSVRANLEIALDSGEHVDETISAGERAMLGNILRLREVRVADVMIPRAEIEAVDSSTSLAELLKLFQSSGHSRMPVYVETLDDPRGMVHIRDVVGHIVTGAAKKRRRARAAAKEKDSAIDKEPVREAKELPAGLNLANVDLSKTVEEAKISRSVLFVPPSMLAIDLMTRMQTSRTQMALVIDEYGGTDGLVSLEDIIEMVFGDIEDEHDDDEIMIEERPDGTLRMDARVELNEIANHMPAGFIEKAHAIDDEVDSIGGLVFSMLGRVPLRGEVVHGLAGLEIEVCEADPRRIRSVIIKQVKAPARMRAKSKESGTVGADG